jgi:hypothetical protein
MKELEEWIDLMEGESWPAQTANLNLLLEHSLADQTVLDNLRRLRQATKEAHEDAAVEKLLKDQAYLEKLHAQIMREVRQKRAGRPTLQVVEHSDSASTQEPDQPISRVSYSR